MNTKKIVGYGALGCITAPLWVPAAFLGYVSYKAARFAFKHQKITFAALGLSGMLWYASSNHGKSLRTTLQHTIVQAFENVQQHKAKTLEEKLNVTHEELEHVNDALQQQKNYAQQLEQRLQQAPQQPAYQKPISQQPPASVPQTPSEQPVPPQPAITAITDPTFNFYYVKRGDTLERISTHVSGTYENHVILQRDNNIDDPRQLLTGQLLKIRKSLCTQYASDVYERVPRLRSMILPGNKTITDMCNGAVGCVEETLDLNRQLGLRYEDSFPYRKGARIVYYR